VAIRAVVFDLFDTLVDLSMQDLPRIEIGGRSVPSTAGVLHEVVVGHSNVDFARFLAVLTDVDRSFREARHAQGLEFPTLERFERVVARLGIDVPELPQRLTETHMDLIRAQVAIPEHHGRVLEDLSRRARLGLCSNFSHAAMALSLLDECGFRARLDALAISEAVGIRKPRAEIFEAVLAELGVTAAEALHVGDSLTADIAGAAPLGIRTVWITRRVADRESALRSYAGPRPDFVISDLSEVEALLERS